MSCRKALLFFSLKGGEKKGSSPRMSTEIEDLPIVSPKLARNQDPKVDVLCEDESEQASTTQEEWLLRIWKEASLKNGLLCTGPEAWCLIPSLCDSGTFPGNGFALQQGHIGRLSGSARSIAVCRPSAGVGSPSSS